MTSAVRRFRGPAFLLPAATATLHPAGSTARLALASSPARVASKLIIMAYQMAIRARCFQQLAGLRAAVCSITAPTAVSSASKLSAGQAGTTQAGAWGPTAGGSHCRFVSSFRSGAEAIPPQDETPDYYKVLGVGRDATPEQIKGAFRELGECCRCFNFLPSCVVSGELALSQRLCRSLCCDIHLCLMRRSQAAPS